MSNFSKRSFLFGLLKGLIEFIGLDENKEKELFILYELSLLSISFIKYLLKSDIEGRFFLEKFFAPTYIYYLLLT